MTEFIRFFTYSIFQRLPFSQILASLKFSRLKHGTLAWKTQTSVTKGLFYWPKLFVIKYKAIFSNALFLCLKPVLN